MLKSALNLLLLALLAGTIGTAVICFGGILPEYALPYYGVAGGLILVWGGKWLFCRHVSGVWTPMHLPVILFVIYALCRYFTSPLEHASRIDLFHIGLYAVLYFLVSQNLHRPRDRAILLCALAALAVGESLYAVYQYRTHSEHVLWLDRGADYFGRGSGTYYCPNHLAGFLEIVIALLAGWLIAYRNPDAPLQTTVLQRLLVFAALIFAGLGLFTTSSRGSWIAIAVALPVLLIVGEIVGAISSRRAIAAFVVILASAGILWCIPAIQNRLRASIGIDLQYRLGEQPVAIKGGFEGRIPMWRATWRLISDHPIFGTGPGTWEWYQLKYRLPESQIRPQYAHNDPLQLIAEYGFTGGALIAALFACFYWQAIYLARTTRVPEQKAFAIGAVAAITAALIHSLVDFNFHIPANTTIVVVLLGLIAAQGRGDHEDDRTRVPVLFKTAIAMALVAIVLGGLRVGAALALSERADARGFAAAQEQDHDEALAHYRRALRLDPQDPDTYIHIGDLYRLQSANTTDPELQPERQLIARRATDEYLAALKYNPLHSEAMLKLAAAYELAGNNDDAFRWYQHAVETDPNNAFVWLRLGTYYARHNDPTQAIRALEHANKLNPSDGTANAKLRELR